MIRLKIPASLVFMALLLWLTAGVRSAHAETVTMESLLAEMTDRDAAARWPSDGYACKEVTSHDPRKKNPADAAGWHSNQDYGNFMRLETNGDRPEWVILDAVGPGAIVRFWAPLLADKDKQIVRFYFDGASKPAITAKLNELICGQSFVRPPLAFISWNQTDLREELKPDYKGRRGVGGDLYLPIPFAKSCKVTLDQLPFYYCINYRSYAPGTSVKTFTMDEFEASKSAVDQAGATLLADWPLVDSLNQQSMVAPGGELSLDLPKGSAAVRDIQVQVAADDSPQVLRSVILQATFDGEPTVWCPLSEFFGVGTRLQAVQDRSQKATADGNLEARWVMPYRRAGRLTLKNGGRKPALLKLSASTGGWAWNNRSLYFHANWHCELGIKTRPMFDWNYIQIQGQGVYVGDTLTVFSPSPNWYGEGDERIYIDGETVPSHIGTGTEDYYGYAWGMANFFSSPFMSTPERDLKSQEDWRGYTTDSRLRLLDAIPFRRHLQLDMEVWDWADTQVDYAVGTFWYGRPKAESNRLPQMLEAVSALKEMPGPQKR